MLLHINNTIDIVKNNNAWPFSFSRTVYFFGRPFICLSCPSVCNIGALWPKGLMDQDEPWHAGRPRPWPHCVRWGPSYPSPNGHTPIFVTSTRLLYREVEQWPDQHSSANASSHLGTSCQMKLSMPHPLICSTRTHQEMR